MNWYYIDGPRRVGPLNETEWAGLVRDGKIQPETLVWHEGMDHQWLPLSEIPAEESETEPPEPPEIPEEILETPEVFAARVVDLDFPVDFDRCISRAWGVFRNNFWLVVGASFLTLAMLALGAAVEIVRYVMPMALQGVILGGLASIYLRIMRGEPAVMSDLFVGFTPALFKQLALRTLVGFLLMELCLIPAAVATEMLGIVSPNFESVLGAEPQKALAVLFQTLQTTMASDPQKVLVWLLIVLTSLIPVAYFSFCWMFATPLIVDKGLRFWPAMQLSRRKVLQHPWRIALLSVVAGIFGYAGMLAFGVGVVFTLPLYFLITLFLYEDMFKETPSKPVDSTPE